MELQGFIVIASGSFLLVDQYILPNELLKQLIPYLPNEHLKQLIPCWIILTFVFYWIVLFVVFAFTTLVSFLQRLSRKIFKYIIFALVLSAISMLVLGNWSKFEITKKQDTCNSFEPTDEDKPKMSTEGENKQGKRSNEDAFPTSSPRQMWCGLAPCIHLSGAVWELTDKYDCCNNDIDVIENVATWPSSEALDNREKCASRCLELPSCVSFVYPSKDFGEKGTCFLKHTHQQSIVLQKHCNRDNTKYQFYSLIERNGDSPDSILNQQPSTALWSFSDDMNDFDPSESINYLKCLITWLAADLPPQNAALACDERALYRANGVLKSCALKGYEYSPVTGLCYSYKEKPSSWFGAKSSCEVEGATLVTIDAIGAYADLKAHFPFNFWVGLAIFDNDDIVWESGSKSHVATNPARSHRCYAAQFGEGGKLLEANVPCGTEKPFLCEMPPLDEDQRFKSRRLEKRKFSPNFRNDEYTCPDGFSLLHKSCYLFAKTAVSFTQAKSACKEYSDSSLVTISSRAENDWIDAYGSYNKISTFYLGAINVRLDKPNELNWERTESQKGDSFTSWNSGEPNFGGYGGEDCVIMLGRNWYDISCVNSYSYVCEVDPTPYIPTY